MENDYNKTIREINCIKQYLRVLENDINEYNTSKHNCELLSINNLSELITSSSNLLKKYIEFKL